MREEVLQQLLEINARFYEEFGASFAATRRRIQPGMRGLLARLPDEGCWLDLGCGSGALAAAWQAAGRKSEYAGLDFSTSLLAEARAAAPGISFVQADLCDPDWLDHLPRRAYAGILAFAVLHHLPGADLRLRILRQVRSLLPPGGWFVHSVWQFQHSPRLLMRTLPWGAVGLAEGDVEPGDTLLDWRSALPDQPTRVGLRYVHLFSRAGLGVLAEQSGFTVRETFESDGATGNLGLYQVWQAV